MAHREGIYLFIFKQRQTTDLLNGKSSCSVFVLYLIESFGRNLGEGAYSLSISQAAPFQLLIIVPQILLSL